MMKFEQLDLLNQDVPPIEAVSEHSLIQEKLSSIKPETYNSVGSMHKYWGKKPYNIISTLIQHYTKEGDTVLDPFCGSGVSMTQAFLSGRRAIGVDLNPSAIFISEESISSVDLKVFDQSIADLRTSLNSMINELYTYECVCGDNAVMIAGVRTREGELTRLKLKCSSCGSIERETTQEDIEKTQLADSKKILNWYPTDQLIHNSRINVKKGQSIPDLFTNRNLNLCAALWNEICKIKNEPVQRALKIAFTANLSNASKLTPIIKQRGAMNAGAWMTGFYVASEFLEQNVLHYFLNRAEKVRKAKVELAQNCRGIKIIPAEFHQSDCSQMNFIKDRSVDFIFADPPYGDTVPYLEQSLLWNSWIGYDAKIFEREIVISDSPARDKKLKNYIEGIKIAFKEINRVAKTGASLCVTFHNMKGEVWSAFMAAILQSGFDLIDVLTIYQKTSTPRQLNRIDSIKCDFLLIFKKTQSGWNGISLQKQRCQDIITDVISMLIKSKGPVTTDMVFSVGLTSLLKEGLPPLDFDIIEAMTETFDYRDGLWYLATIQ